MTFDSAARMSVLNAVIEIQDYVQRFNGTSVLDAAGALRESTARVEGFDFAAAVDLLDLLPMLGMLHAPTRLERLRLLLFHLIREFKPAWLRVVPYGRGYLRPLIDSSNTCQCLESAGLYDRRVDPSMIRWWDEVALMARGNSDDADAAIGREGESLTIAYEQERLATAGRPDLQPLWVAIEDNTLGYDVRSFELNNDEIRPIHIEAKATYAQPPRFFLSRSEWDKAQEFGGSYRLYLWALPARQLSVLRRDDLRGHIPIDQGSGRWQTTEIRDL